MALDFQALVAGEKVSTTVAVKLEHTELVQGIVEQEMIQPTCWIPSSSTSMAILLMSVTSM